MGPLPDRCLVWENLRAMNGQRPHFARAVSAYVGRMTRISIAKQGKMETHGAAAGLFSAQDLKERAAEIARIAGRAEVTDQDYDQARAELRDANLPSPVSADADASMTSLSRDPSDPAVDRGRQTPEYLYNDEEEAVERLALEGVEEAQHDQMIEARNAEAEADEREDRDAG
jgi:hypothetical protein